MVRTKSHEPIKTNKMDNYTSPRPTAKRKVTVVETNINTLQSKYKKIKELAQHLVRQQALMAARLEDQVQRQRQCFEHVNKALQAKELKYMMQYHAKLHVITDGKAWLFSTLEEAWDWQEGWRTSDHRKRRTTENNSTGGTEGCPTERDSPGPTGRNVPLNPRDGVPTEEQGLRDSCEY
ncbi:hypothetical protein NDU88_007503 [Pleurodeles waltl]|uniref:Uncharacterized protein n=1 Tax=Pleurodeles waltl TaxID=8319 RepID=A0AAV7NW52_PLEWA|nr:hypothetical protein NDU88_007503 [Pleurodeles waltl]